ncbi:MAG: hypothetical protein ACRDV4_03685 [Acidimicrobiales bacterium]
MQLDILFWFYKDALLCTNRLRMLRHKNPSSRVYGLYGGPIEEADKYAESLGDLLDDFWAFPGDMDRDWKWRNGDLVIRNWFADRGKHLPWDSVFVAQWDLVVSSPLAKLLPRMEAGEMLISGLRPIRDVEGWWQWMRGDARAEYEKFRTNLVQRYGKIDDPMCCQFIALVIPRAFLESYERIDEPELGFLEYKVPMYAQAFGIELVPDTCFRPWWPEEPATSGAKRTDTLVHAWRTPVHLPVILYERFRPSGRRAYHPYHGVYPHDVASLEELVRHARRR